MFQPSFGQKGNPGASQYDFAPRQTTGTKPGSRQGTTIGTGMKKTGEFRPMTSIQKTNYIADPMRQTQSRLEKNKQPQGPDEQFKKIEREINKLIEESALASVRGAHSEALDKAKEATVKEKQLRKLKESNVGEDLVNPELTYCVTFNLANQYQNNGMYQDAITTYTSIVKNKQYMHGGRLRVNMGNIYFIQKKYLVAIKMYRMALDLIPKSSKEMRAKIRKNIGIAFVKLGNFQEAIETYESILQESPDFPTAFNLLLCLYAIGDKDRLKRYFTVMVNIELPGLEEELDEELAPTKDDAHETGNDKLKEELKEKKRTALKFIVDAAKLIAPVIEEDIIEGYEWIISVVKASFYAMTQSEIEICKALAFLKKKSLEKAIETLKSFEKKDKVIMAKASTNISFLYFMEGDYQNAERYAEIAVEHDRFNAKALVNRGNCLFVRNEFLRAKEQYLEAIGVQADCIEALYNLAFVNKKLNMFIEALQALEKLQTIVSSSPEVIYQIANLNELMGNSKAALRWYQILLTKLSGGSNTKGPTDPNILARMGTICARDEDDHQALHYYTESYKLYPVNLETISWLGIYYVRSELYEKASHFFERAAQIQPKEVKWKLMVASCYRRTGSSQRALSIYEEIYAEYPDNIECLRFLVQLCKELGLPFEEYAGQLRQLERQLEAVEARYPFNQGFDQYGGGEDDNQQGNDEEVEPNINVNGESSTRNANRKVTQKPKKQENENEWANQELGDDLLPM